MSNEMIGIMGSGALGLWTAQALLDAPPGHAPAIRIGNTRGRAPAWLPPRVRAATLEGRVIWHAIQALDADSVRRFAAGTRAVVQTATPSYAEWAQKLPVIQRNAIAAALAAEARLICADNLYAYALPAAGARLTERSPEDPPSGKGRVRLEMGELLRREQGLRWSAVQGSQYFGPGAMSQSMFGDWFVDPVLKGRKARFVGNPALAHSWAYAPDFGRAMALLCLDDRPDLLGRHWILPHATDIPARELGRALIAEIARQGFLPAGAPRDTGAIPGIVLRAFGLFDPTVRARQEMVYQFVNDFTASGAAFTAATGLVATPLDEAIRATVDFWRETRAARPAVK